MTSALLTRVVALFPVAGYVATRAVALALLAPQIELLADLTNYGKALAHGGATRSLFEYPWLAAELLELPLRLGTKSWPQYYATLIALFVVVDAAYAAALWRASGRHASRGFLLWLAAVPLLGPLMFTRFDLVAAALAGTALLALADSRPAAAGVLSVLGAAVKIWPVFALPGMLASAAPNERRRLLDAVLAAAAFVAGATLLFAGAARLLSPFVLQAARGLEVEAVAALPFLWARLADPASVAIETAACSCLEIRAGGVAAALSAAQAAFWAGVIGFALVLARVMRAPPQVRTPGVGAQLALLLVILWIVTNKVFSPQYMVWAVSLMAVWGAVRGPALPGKDMALLLAACALTQLLYPSQHMELFGPEPRIWPLVALTLRDALVAALGIRVARQVWRESAAHG